MDLSLCVTPEATKSREVFFRGVFGFTETGFVCIAISNPPKTGRKRTMIRRFFKFPDQLPIMLKAIQDNLTQADIYFCPQLLYEEDLNKGTVSVCPNAWADLDACLPSKLKIPASLVWETSPGRYQAIWRFEESLKPPEAENLSRRIAYYHASDGADRSGWDLTQFLRVPLTANFKYLDKIGTPAPIIEVVGGTTTKYRLDDFEVYPPVQDATYLELPMPAVADMPTEEPLELVQKYRRQVNPLVFELMSTEPLGSWSEPLWRLLMMLLEAGMTLNEVFHVAESAACNKYRRDQRPAVYLWRDVCRAQARYQQSIGAVVMPNQKQEELLTADEASDVDKSETFVERYIEWASGLGDAAVQYHQAGGFVILSTLLAGRVVLPTSFGTIIPNLWFMILADTTVTRKSTAMDIAMDMIYEVDSDALLATDGSIEGLLQSLQARPGRASIFLRDEFSGLLEMMVKRDYYAGMAEMLTKLYDGKPQKRILRRETVEVREPILILFAGGIRNRIQSLLTSEHVSSGFIPRFLFITAESDISKVRPLGPPTVRDTGNRDALLHEMSDLVAHYHVMESRTTPKKWYATLTSKAWARYNKLETDLLQDGLDSQRPDLLTPVCDRLAKSTLKAAILIAASRQRNETVTVEERDIVTAIKYCISWRSYAIEIVTGVGKSVNEREMEKILGYITKHPGSPRARLMRNYHMTSKAADTIFDTLQQRGLIQVVRVSNTTVLYPVMVGDSK